MSENAETYDSAADHQHGSEIGPSNPADIQLGDGDKNHIILEGIVRNGPSLIVPTVIADADSFLVLHSLENGAPLQTDYVGSTFVSAGKNQRVAVRLDDIPETGTPFIIMLHADVNQDQAFQFGDGVTVPDAPVFEGNTLIAKPMQVPANSRLTQDIIRNSAQEHFDKAAAFAARAAYREDSELAQAHALIHHWFAEIETPEKSIDRIAPLLASNFVINFSSGPISDLDTLETWLLGPASSFEATRHVLHDVELTPSDTGDLIISMTMHWNGLMEDGSLMKARTAQRWIMSSDEAGAFKIKRIDVDILEPFQPTSWDDDPL